MSTKHVQYKELAIVMNFDFVNKNLKKSINLETLCPVWGVQSYLSKQ